MQYKIVTRDLVAQWLVPAALVLSLFLFNGTTSAQASAANTAQIIGVHLVGRQDDNPGSGYSLLIKQLLQRSPIPVEYERFPFARAYRSFKEKERVCLFPSSKTSIEFFFPELLDELPLSAPIDLVTAHIFSAADAPILNDIQALVGKTIAAQHGVTMTPLLREKLPRQPSPHDFATLMAVFEGSIATINRTPDDLTALRMVQAGRVDGMYGWYPDTYIIAQKNGLSLPHFNPDFILFETTTHVLCKAFIGNEKLISAINKGLRDLKNDGRLQEILGKHARIVKE